MQSIPATCARLPALVLFACCACSVANQPADRHPRPAQGIDLAYCLRNIEDKTRLESARCPGFLIESLTAARRTCVEVGGKLAPATAAKMWTMDVNADNKKEFTFQHEGNVECEGAFSVFSCGSLGCPMMLYEEHGGAWGPIAAIYADAPESIELLDNADKSYRDLRVGCSGEQACTEYWFYLWQGEHYERVRAEVRGFRVAFADSLHGLYPLVAKTALLATPAPDGRVIDRYDADMDVAIIGTAEAAAPCIAG